MNFSMSESMLYGGMIAFGVLAVILAVMLKVFKAARKKLAEKIDAEMNER